MMRVLSALLLAGCFSTDPTPTVEAVPPAAVEAAPAAPTAFDAELAALDEKIAWNLKRSETLGGSWLVLESAAGLLMERARLSGDYNDYARAESLLTEAFSLAPERSGPFMTRAQLNYTLHRLDAVDPDLAQASKRLLLNNHEQGSIALLRANLALQRGDYAAAKNGYDEALALSRSMSAVCSVAVFEWKTGDTKTAEARFDEAEDMLIGDSATRRAWLHLQRGLIDLDHGRLDDAMAHYRTAESILPGHWLIEEHIAEVLTATDQADAALRVYGAVIERTGNPEFMDAVAEILAQREDASAPQWVARAREAHDARLALFPEAAAGHALDHYLAHASPAEALALAQANLDTRPNTEARIGLAAALLTAGQLEAAAEQLAIAEASPWVAADIHTLAAELALATGDRDAATAALGRAQSIDATATVDGL
ncbi:MAG: tetratricopeptide (TPR) repeat protein [Myxococcota bacterium]|jgi:tetratricopeptide (TPR) repeat protein